MNPRKALTIVLVGLFVASASAAVISTTTESAIKSGNAGSLDNLISSNDCLQGMIATELPGDTGWHPAVGDPLDKLPAFTDGIGMRGTGLTGLLNDFPGEGNPAKLVDYDVTGTDCNTLGVQSINIHSSNNEDGRVFSTTVIRYSMDGGSNYNLLGYFESHPSGTINSLGHPQSIGIKSAMVSVFDDGGAALIPAGVTNITFEMFASNNTQGQKVDAWNGINPYTGLDDGYGDASFPNEAKQSPLIMEVDVFAVPEPTSLLLIGLAGMLIRRR